ncbi:MAG: glycosyl hydrolase family 3 [Lutibacter sp.]|uniref:glycoside hydrolase family 3 protein n=1 Tax=Lutibacter sp. TaxID=1925666 RepID=UPI0017DFE990|nr:glycoside hydrolase family 3 N-terminal domain-containing protein [Lutibacter sp.]MBT8318008.1 glycoside hydrolase family 3 C-terminal domain-containing protein [Lutibacter sp.]NNJ58867.1 glycosyl hydrolase family 3 [Lutibacter sp.]
MIQLNSSTLNKIILISFFFYALSSCQKPLEKLVTEDTIIEKKVDSLLSLMTLEEKIGQMSQVRHFSDITDEDIATKFIGSVIHTQGPTPGKDAEEWQARFITLQKKALSTRLGIPLLFGVDAVHGQNTFEGATIFPHNIGMGATHNSKLVQEAAEITAIETQATGFNWTFSPCIAIPYNEKWGRVYEAFSESTELTEEMAIASVKGHQGKLSDSSTVMATAKHYIGDGSTDFGIEGGNTSLNLKEVSERLLPPYRAAVKAGVGSIMVSFNAMSNKAMHAHKELITDTLKTSMGFDGIVVTDWKGYSRFGKNDIINAGVDMVMAVDGDLAFFQNGLKKGIDSEYVAMERVNDAVKRILRQKFRLGLFKNPFPNASLIQQIGSSEHRAKARQAVRESLVLLKNQDKVLPIDKSAKKIVVVGEHANNSGLQSGGWTIAWQGVKQNYKGATTILDGIKKIAKGDVVYDMDATGNHLDADVAIIVVGETPYAEVFGDIGDGNGTYKLSLSEKHKSYIQNYSNKGIDVIVVLISGRPLVVTPEIVQTDAFVAAWLPGSEGDGIAEVLFGDFNFTGKLPHSWPKYEKDFEGTYGPNFWNNTITPLYEFGYGLTY